MKVAQKGKNMLVSEMIGGGTVKADEREGSASERVKEMGAECRREEKSEERQRETERERERERRMMAEREREVERNVGSTRWIANRGWRVVDEWAAERLFARSHLISKSANHTRM